MFDRVESKLRIAAIAALLLLAPAAPALLAQDEEGTPPEVEKAVADAEEAAASAEMTGLVADIEARFEVLPIRDGLILRPRSAGTGILSIEITDGDLAIDGEPVSRSEARSRLGSDARAVLRLADLDPDEARELFRLGGPPSPPRPRVRVEVGEGPEPPELPEIPPPRPPRPFRQVEAGSGQRLNILSDVAVRSGETVDQAVAIGGSVTVDGEVREDAVAVGGSTRVNGEVGGTVAAIGGSVFLGPDAVVHGDALSVGGTVTRADGAQVEGQVIQVSASKGLFGGPWSWARDDEEKQWFRGDEVSDLVTGVIVFGVFLLLFWLIYVIAPEPVGRVSDRVRRDPWTAALAGLLTAVLFVPVLALVAVVLAISIVGIPLLLLLPFVILLFFVALLMGYAAVSLAVGRLLERSFGWRLGSPYLVILVGAAVLEIFVKLGDLIDVIGPLSTPAGILLAVGWAVRSIAALIGLGAVVLTRFGTWPRPAVAAAPAAATPPVTPPPAPPPEEEPDLWPEPARDDDWPPSGPAADDDSEPRT